MVRIDGSCKIGLFLNLDPLTFSIEDFSQLAANWLP